MKEEITDVTTYIWAVTSQAIDLGFSAAQVMIFREDIRQCYYDGKSVDECVNEVL